MADAQGGSGIVTQVADPADQRAYRDLLGGYVTGVVLVTALADGMPVGVAVNSFTSVSLDPPLVAFCAAHSSATWPGIRDTGAFAVSILREDQEPISRVFARRGADRFADPAARGTFDVAPSGIPVVRGSLGWLDCTIAALHDAGDHELVVARVTAMSRPGAGSPLLYFRGGYARLDGSPS